MGTKYEIDENLRCMTPRMNIIMMSMTINDILTQPNMYSKSP